MASALNGLNWPLLTIPAYYVFCLTPHMYAMSLLQSNGYKPDNANPRASLSSSSTQGKVPEEIFKKYQRAENAHSNGMEQMPFYAAAVLASVMAERVTAGGQSNRAAGNDVTGLSTFVASWFAVRVLYNVAYVAISTTPMSFVRSGLWFVGISLASYQIYKAAELLGA